MTRQQEGAPVDQGGHTVNGGGTGFDERLVASALRAILASGYHAGTARPADPVGAPLANDPPPPRADPGSSLATQVALERERTQQIQARMLAEAKAESERTAEMARRGEEMARQRRELEHQRDLLREIQALREREARGGDPPANTAALGSAPPRPPLPVPEIQTPPPARTDYVQPTTERYRLPEPRRKDQANPEATHSSGSSDTTATPPSQVDLIAVLLAQGLRGTDREKFKGDPLKYPLFLRDFQDTTAKLRGQPGDCLRILRSQLEGQALEIITHHLVDDDAERGLADALDTLERAYGSHQKQSRAQLDALLKRSKVDLTESALMKFYSELDSCQKIMRRCKRAQELDATGTLEQLYAKLPELLRKRWAKEIDLSPDRVPTFALLMKIVKEEHRRRTGELSQWDEALRAQKRGDGKKNDGKRNDTKQDEGKNPKAGNHSRAYLNQVGAETPGVQVNQVTAGASGGQGNRAAGGASNRRPPTTRCFCAPTGQQHQCLADCPSYRAAPNPGARWDLLRGSGVCFRCLHYGHLANDCPEGACEHVGCAKRHHKTLHTEGRDAPPSRTRSTLNPGANPYTGAEGPAGAQRPDRGSGQDQQAR